MELYKFTHLLWVFNMLIDSGKYDGLSVSDVKEHIRDGTLPGFLTSMFPDGDFSMISTQEWTYLIKEWQWLADGVDERRKMGIENRGICLLMAYTLNGLQAHPDNQRNKLKNR